MGKRTAPLAPTAPSGLVSETSAGTQTFTAQTPDAQIISAPTATATRAAGGTAPRIAQGEPGFSERYRAISSRDERFDGQFYTAVTSTRIYCRPSCPARTPQESNVVFYRTSAAAHTDGFRACRRCYPEASPGSPEWNLRADTASRAMKLIDDGVVDREGVGGVADRLGYTSRHVNRILTQQLGCGTLALARAKRAQTARTLLIHTSLKVTDIAYAAGFSSVRQCNDTVRDVFHTTPTGLRASRRARPSGESPAPQSRGALPPDAANRPVQDAPVRLCVTLPVRAPYDARGVWEFFAARALRGTEHCSRLPAGALRCARTLHLPSGPGACDVTFTPSGSTWTVRAELELTALADVSAALTRVRRLFDLDADPAAIDHVLTHAPITAGPAQRHPGIRVPGAVDPTEIIVRAIVGQQISVRAAVTHLSRLIERFGAQYTSAFDGLDRLFPTAHDLARGIPPAVAGQADPGRPLRLPARSVNTVRRVCADLAAGALVAGPECAPEELSQALSAYAGVGTWTARYVVMRLLGDPDVWLEGDMYLRGLDSTQCSPWRSYACALSWRSAWKHGAQ